MREIKFRGKSVHNGEWVYGHYMEDKRYKSHVIFGFIKDKMNHSGLEIVQYEVYPETIGQYTGLKDKNGVEVYEGDVLESMVNRSRINVVFECGAFGYYFSGFHPLKGLIDYNDNKVTCEVIGNIHDKEV